MLGNIGRERPEAIFSWQKYLIPTRAADFGSFLHPEKGPSAPCRCGGQISSSSLRTFVPSNRARLLKPASARKIKARSKNSKPLIGIAGEAERRGHSFKAEKLTEGSRLAAVRDGDRQSPWSGDSEGPAQNVAKSALASLSDRPRWRFACPAWGLKVSSSA